MAVSERTQDAYWKCVRQLSDYFHKPPEEVTPEELRQYFIFLKCEKKVARQTATQAICASKLFWEKSLRRVWPAEVKLVRANLRVKLPVVLAALEVRSILSKVALLDHRVALITIQLQVNLGHSSPVITALYTHLTSLCKTQHQKRLDEFMGDL